MKHLYLCPLLVVGALIVLFSLTANAAVSGICTSTSTRHTCTMGANDLYRIVIGKLDSNDLDRILICDSSDGSTWHVLGWADYTTQSEFVFTANDSSNIIRVVQSAASYGDCKFDDLPDWYPSLLEIYGEDGDDTIYGSQYNDVIHGGDDDDTIAGNDGDDTIYGDDGDDTLRGRGGMDRLNGGAGRDDIFGGIGSDRLLGGDSLSPDDCDGEAPTSPETDDCDADCTYPVSCN